MAYMNDILLFDATTITLNDLYYHSYDEATIFRLIRA